MINTECRNTCMCKVYWFYTVNNVQKICLLVSQTGSAGWTLFSMTNRCLFQKMELNLETTLRDTPRELCFPVNFQSPKDYLHHLHSLLKEDFLGPLRKDISNICKSCCDQLVTSICHGAVEIESRTREAPNLQKV